MVVVSIVLTAGGLWLVDVILRDAAEPLGFEAFNNPAALPLLMLVLATFGLLLSPAQRHESLLRSAVRSLRPGVAPGCGTPTGRRSPSWPG